MFYYINAALTTREQATVSQTEAKRVSAWTSWRSFLVSIGLTESPFLDGLPRHKQNLFVSAFAQAVREAAFSKGDRESLVAKSVSTTLSHVVQTFRSNHRPDPRLDSDGRTCILLEDLFRAYRAADGSEKKQKALPFSVLRTMAELAVSDKDHFITDLLIGAMFFTMRSCEYIKTTAQDGAKRTKILCLSNFTFRSRGRILDIIRDDLSIAETVVITFEFQKNDKRNQQVHMYRTHDKLLCPVKAWSRVIKRIITTIPNYNMNTKVCIFMGKADSKPLAITGNKARSKLRSTVKVIGIAVLGFAEMDIGLHSISSGGAMEMFLSGVSPIIIQRVGRWASLAFLEYIREQTDRFTFRVSDKMLQNEKYYHLNEIEGKGLKYHDESTELQGDGIRKVPFTTHFTEEVLGHKFELYYHWTTVYQKKSRSSKEGDGWNLSFKQNFLCCMGKN